MESQGHWRGIALEELGADMIDADRSLQLLPDEQHLGTLPFRKASASFAPLIDIPGVAVITSRRLGLIYSSLPATYERGPLKGQVLVPHERVRLTQRRRVAQQATVTVACNVVPYTEVGQLEVWDDGSKVSLSSDPEVVRARSLAFDLPHANSELQGWMQWVADAIAVARGQTSPVLVRSIPNPRDLERGKHRVQHATWSFTTEHSPPNPKPGPSFVDVTRSAPVTVFSTTGRPDGHCADCSAPHLAEAKYCGACGAAIVRS
jgi:hypothetical protein